VGAVFNRDLYGLADILIEVSRGLNLAEAAGAATLGIAAASRFYMSSNCPAK